MRCLKAARVIHALFYYSPQRAAITIGQMQSMIHTSDNPPPASGSAPLLQYSPN